MTALGRDIPEASWPKADVGASPRNGMNGIHRRGTGMHGQKKRRKRPINGAAEIDGYSLQWELVSEPQWTTEGSKGLCVAVKRVEGSFRELLIEYPFDKSALFPQRPKLTAAIVEVDIRDAIADGWNPEARGRAFVFMAQTKLEVGKRPAGISKWFV